MWGVIAAFAGVYLIWGSTYLGIRYAIQTIPPFVMSSVRFLIAGVILTGWAWWRGSPAPTRTQWKETAIIGGLLLVVGNGAVVWAEQRVTSGLAALLVAIVPLWMVLLDWLRPGGTRPGAGVIAGVLLGLGGLAMLIGSGVQGSVDPTGAAILVVGAFGWAVGSLRARRVSLPASAVLTTGMEMLAAGTMLGVIALATGEVRDFDPGGLSRTSLVAFIYLILVGSVIGFTCYAWLLQVTTPARASTYAYVNPVVAVFLGWLIAGEQLTTRMLLAGAIIVGAVAMIAFGQATPPNRPRPTIATDARRTSRTSRTAG